MLEAAIHEFEFQHHGSVMTTKLIVHYLLSRILVWIVPLPAYDASQRSNSISLLQTFPVVKFGLPHEWNVYNDLGINDQVGLWELVLHLHATYKVIFKENKTAKKTPKNNGVMRTVNIWLSPQHSNSELAFSASLCWSLIDHRQPAISV